MKVFESQRSMFEVLRLNHWKPFNLQIQHLRAHEDGCVRAGFQCQSCDHWFVSLLCFPDALERQRRSLANHCWFRSSGGTCPVMTGKRNIWKRLHFCNIVAHEDFSDGMLFTPRNIWRSLVLNPPAELIIVTVICTAKLWLFFLFLLIYICTVLNF